MTGRIEGKVALITGAGSLSGIGFASARRMNQEGASVILTDMPGSELDISVEELKRQGFCAAGWVQDVTDEPGWGTAIANAVAQFGRLDILVNCAGIAIERPVKDLSLDDFRRQMDVNFTGTFLGCRAAVRQMLAQGDGGAIVNISSTAALTGSPGLSIYCASKAAVHLMTKALALEVGRDGIRVNSVHPGMTQTQMLQGLQDEESPLVKIIAALPLGRAAAPDEVAAMVAFLASEDATYCLGGTFVVDGGLTAL